MIQIRLLVFGSSLKLCCLTGWLIKYFGSHLKSVGTCNLFRKSPPVFWYYILVDKFPRKMQFPLDVFSGSPCILFCFRPCIVLKYQSMLIFQTISLIVRGFVGLLGCLDLFALMPNGRLSYSLFHREYKSGFSSMLATPLLFLVL